MKKGKYSRAEYTDENENNENCSEENSGDSSLTDGCFPVSSKGHIFYCLTVIGQIEGHYILPSTNKTTKYEHMIPKIVSIEEDERIDGMLLILNTVGGDIEAGLAIAELISGMKKPTVSLVLGGGHSIGVPLAVSTKKSFITKTATMTLHPVRMNGLIIGVPQQFDYFKNMQERIISFICGHSRMKEEILRQMMMKSGELIMDFGTVLDGESAVKEGLIDSLGSISDAMAALEEMAAESNNS